MYYNYFLNGPVERSSIQAMYEEIRARCPYIALSDPVDTMVRFTYDHDEALWKTRTPPGLEYRGYIDIDVHYSGDENEGSRYEPELSYHLRNGRNQLHLEVTSWQGIGRTMLREPEHGLELLDLMAIAARNTDPIVGFFITEASLDTVDWPAFSAMEFLIAMLKAIPTGSIYLDARLADEVGVEWLRRWADVLVQVDDLGYLVEAGGYLGPETPDRRDDNGLTYRGYWVVLEHIIERLVKEYGYRKNSFGKYV